jgi:site-specific DNA-methyltransferase (adenine-specific)
MTSFLDGKVRLLRGDCLELLPTLEENSIDSIVTDPPYGLQFMGREWDKLWRNDTDADKAYVEKTKGKLTSRQRKLPDYSATKPAQMQEFHYLWAKECLRLLKPGAHLLAFSSPRTYHRLASAVEDAGFEIRDMVSWNFGSGFPKSHNLGNGLGTALKPAHEPIVLARKPLSESSIAANVLKHGTGGINVDGCRIEATNRPKREVHSMRDDVTYGGNSLAGRVDGSLQSSKAVGTTDLGRWPANLIHDGSEEVVSRFPDTGGPHHNGTIKRGGDRFGGTEGDNRIAVAPTDSGSAARFFYTAKADSDDRLGSKHPTVKPIDLIQYLCRLVTPRGALVLDPFAGTGTTGEAAYREGLQAVLIEREPEYQADIERRMALVLAGPEERIRESIKARGLVEEAGPLFGGTG